MAILDTLTRPFFGIPAKAPPKAKANARGRAAPAEDGDMDILDKLGQEHDDVQDMLERLVASTRAPERTQLLKSIKQALVPHVRAEEKVVYDRVLKLKSKDAKIDGHEGYFEHATADGMLAKLGKIQNKTSPEFTAAAKVLKELIDHHVKEEEDALWGDVKDNFSDEQRVAMNREFEAAKKKVKVA